jgi:hypothetical protein
LLIFFKELGRSTPTEYPDYLPISEASKTLKQMLSDREKKQKMAHYTNEVLSVIYPVSSKTSSSSSSFLKKKRCS